MKFAAFDIDGTLIRWQLYHSMVQSLATSGKLGKKAEEQLDAARMKWKRRESSEEFREYELVVLKIYEDALHTLQPAEFDKHIDAVIEEFKDQVYVYTKNLIKKLKHENYLLFAISGSHLELVERIARYYGFDDWIGTIYERDQARFTGKKYVPSFNKKQALESLVKKHGVGFTDSLAIGDSHSDGAMLEMVEYPIAFNPEKRLLDLAQTNGWKIVIERKNVIYELNYKNESYVLAEAGK